jgi:hypothetical protein
MCALKVHVFQGGEWNINVIPLYAAVSEIKRTGNVDLKVVFKNVDVVKGERMQPADLVDWLLDSDIHLIIAHPHQGIISKHIERDEAYGWSADILKGELMRLKDHAGFPNGEQLTCPIWLQVSKQFPFDLFSINHTLIHVSE